MNNRALKLLGIAALVVQCLITVACSSSSGTTGTGGSTGGGVGGTSGDGSVNPGSCNAQPNPDFEPGGACAPDCQSVSCGRACTVDCCVTCGIDQTGTKTCICRNPGGPYANCSCIQPPSIPANLQGGPCVPAGYSTVAPPATDPTGISIRGMPCTTTNLVCFTLDSTAASERGCICQGGTMHCGSVNHWFTNNGTPTAF